MTERTATTAINHPDANQSPGATITLRVPRPTTQVIVLGLIAFLTLFQTIQLVRISASTTAFGSQAKPAAVSPSSPTTAVSTNANNTDTPQTMVGGC